MNKPIAAPRSLKLSKIGNSGGVILPKQVLARLGVAPGDGVSVVDTPERGSLPSLHCARSLLNFTTPSLDQQSQ